jgi:hypothetical protein
VEKATGHFVPQAQVKTEVKEDSDLAVIPGEMTKLLHPLDIIIVHSRSLSGSFTTNSM